MTDRRLLPDRGWQILGAINFDAHQAAIIPHDFYNVTSITDNGGAGDFTITWDQDFVTASSYCIMGSVGGNAGLNIGMLALHNSSTPMTAQSVRIQVIDHSGSGIDPLVTVVAIGKV